MKQKYERLPGMCDTLSDETARRQVVQSRLATTMETFGYQSVEVPILERADLFLKKTGEQLAARMYSFDYKNRRVCLRPEFTSAIGRLYIDQLVDHTLPVRLQYSGSVFRIDGPTAEGQGEGAVREKRHQFSQVGIELLGASGAAADAEVIAAACHGLDSLGLQRYHVVLSHMGTVASYLQGLKLDPRAVNLLLGKMDELAHTEQGIDHLEEALHALYPDLVQTTPPPHLPDTSPRLSLPDFPLPDNLDEGEAKAVISSFLDGIRIDFGSVQQQDEVIERLLLKLKYRSQGAGLREALSFISELSALQGPASTVFAALDDFYDRYKISKEPLLELATVVRLIILQGVPAEKIYLNLALSRGFQYYTGIIFDLYSDFLVEETRLGGGGRYDDLIGLLGGPHLPACGFSYMLEPLLRALQAEGTALTKPGAANPQIYIAPLGESEIEDALTLAEKLRRSGLRVVSSLTTEIDEEKAFKMARAVSAELFISVHKKGPDNPGLKLSKTDSAATGKKVSLDGILEEIGPLLKR